MLDWSRGVLVLCFFLAACSTSENSSGPPVVGSDACSVDGQKQFVLDAMRDVYFWNDLLPGDVDLSTYATPEALLADLITVQPLDNFSYIDSFAADSQFFTEGEYEGYGFSSRFNASNELFFASVFASSPAATVGFERGQQIVMLNGRTIADIEANEGLGVLFDMPTLEFTVRRQDDSEFVINVNQGLVSIDPVPQWRVITQQNGTSVGYVELVTFIGTAHARFESVFADFAAADVVDVIIDLRYNGGGRVDTTELLGDFLGGVSSEGRIFSQTLFNANNAVANRTALFQQPANSINLSSLIVIATDSTASASELITNSMFPHANVSIVGGTTLGKPVGQLGLQFCDKILRPTSFETVNADNEGGYFAGLPADCEVADDLSVPVGDDADPNLMTALFLLENGACPASAAVTPAAQKTRLDRGKNNAGRQGPAWRRLAGAW